ASGSADGLLRVWEADAGSDPAQRTRPLMRATGHSGEIFTLAYSRDGRFLASGGLDQAVHLWRTANGKPVRQLNAHTGSILSLRFSPDDRFLASSSIDHTIVLWDVGRGRLLHRLTDHLGWVYEVEFDQSGETLLSVSTDRRVLFWDVSSGQPYYSLRLPTMGNSLNLSPDNKRLAVGLFDGSVHIWDVEEILAGRQTLIDQKEMLHGEQPAEQVIGGEMGWVWAVRFSPDGKYLATGSEDKQVRLWELKTERVSCLLSGHSRGVYRIAFSQDSRLLASSSSDEKICLWEVATGRLLGHFAVPGLYEGLNVTGVSGLSDSELDALLKHGAVLG
ncbi:MAG: WD40 repeat domain-containing protein, partial [Chloroflexota bacterium]